MSKQPKYPELANESEWTSRMLYIHQRGMKWGTLGGLGIGICFASMFWIVAYEMFGLTL